MTQPINNLFDRKKFKVLGHAPSLAEARDYAELLLAGSSKKAVTEALDYYHNTLIQELQSDLNKL